MHYIHVPCSVHFTAVFNVSLELQGGSCSDQLTLICRHDAVPTDPNWIHNGTAEAGELLVDAFPGLMMYSFQNSTEHRATVTEAGIIAGYIFQCVYSIRGNPIKSNAVKYTLFLTVSLNTLPQSIMLCTAVSRSFIVLLYAYTYVPH